jgi:hypothetical protein
MLRPTRGLLRGVRAASLGIGGFVLALMAHLAAGGATPGPVVLLLLAGLTGLAALLLTGVRLRPVQVVVSLTTMQVALHEAFMWPGSPTACAMTGMSAPTGKEMDVGTEPMLDCATGMAQAGMGRTSVLAGLAMVIAHVAATAAMTAVLAYGEKVLWFLAGWVRPRRWLRVVLAEIPPARIGFSGAPRMSLMAFACGGVGRRGPPPRGLFVVI